MRSIPVLAVNATDVLDEITAAKHQPRRRRMEAVRARVLAAYETYEGAVPEIGGLVATEMTDLQKEAMRHAFTAETEPMTRLRGGLLERVCVARCPFCGISESSTLDHYLPKEQYPEFSVFPQNLVPSCAVCNTRKRDRIIDQGTKVRMFLHPCYDRIPAIAFLEARVRIEANALVLSYRLVRPDGMALRVYQHLQSHFTELNLADRYRLMGLEHLAGHYHAFRRAYGRTRDAIRVAERLRECAEDFEDAFGLNYWMAQLYLALAKNADFCDGGFEAVRPNNR
ncbi:HNH endonuclease [Paracoccus yeei]|uniref:HNH endonuclease n=1 Tax=Paracoccus yeei TaxID=147645 RepID=UPI0011B05D67|nr:hypothetical protein [Paracoccus yeei]